MEHDAYIQNLIDTGLVINSSIISPYKVYTGTTPLINYIKV